MSRGFRFGKRIPQGGVSLSVCDRCGAGVPASQLRREWTGRMTCVGHANGAHNCWEPKHPSLNFQAPVDYSLTRPNPRQPRDDFATPPMTFDELVASLRGTKS